MRPLARRSPLHQLPSLITGKLDALPRAPEYAGEVYVGAHPSRPLPQPGEPLKGAVCAARGWVESGGRVNKKTFDGVSGGGGGSHQKGLLFSQRGARDFVAEEMSHLHSGAGGQNPQRQPVHDGSLSMGTLPLGTAPCSTPFSWSCAVPGMHLQVAPAGWDPWLSLAGHKVVWAEP